MILYGLLLMTRLDAAKTCKVMMHQAISYSFKTRLSPDFYFFSHSSTSCASGDMHPCRHDITPCPSMCCYDLFALSDWAGGQFEELIGTWETSTYSVCVGLPGDGLRRSAMDPWMEACRSFCLHHAMVCQQCQNLWIIPFSWLLHSLLLIPPKVIPCLVASGSLGTCFCGQSWSSFPLPFWSPDGLLDWTVPWSPPWTCIDHSIWRQLHDLSLRVVLLA